MKNSSFSTSASDEDDLHHLVFDMKGCDLYKIVEDNQHTYPDDDCDDTSDVTTLQVRRAVFRVVHDHDTCYQYVVCQVIPYIKRASKIPISTSLLSLTSLPSTPQRGLGSPGYRWLIAGNIFCICMPHGWTEDNLCQVLLAEHLISLATVPLRFKNTATYRSSSDNVTFLRLEEPKLVRILCNILEYHPIWVKKERYILDCKSTHTVKQARQILFKACEGVLPAQTYPWFYETSGRLLLETDYIYYGSNSGVLNNAHNEFKMFSVRLELLSISTIPLRLKFADVIRKDEYLIIPELISIRELRDSVLRLLPSCQHLSQEAVVLKLGHNYTIPHDSYLMWSPIVNEIGIHVFIDKPIIVFVNVKPYDQSQKSNMIELRCIQRFCTVSQLKEQLSERIQCDAKTIKLNFKLKTPQNDATLKDCGIQNNDVLYAEIHKYRDSVPVLVLNTKQTVHVTFNDISKVDIRDLKLKLSFLINVRPEDIAIRENDTILPDYLPLVQYANSLFVPLLAVLVTAKHSIYFVCNEKGVINIRSSVRDGTSGNESNSIHKSEMCMGGNQHNQELVMSVKQKKEGFFVIYEDATAAIAGSKDIGPHFKTCSLEDMSSRPKTQYGSKILSPDRKHSSLSFSEMQITSTQLIGSPQEQTKLGIDRNTRSHSLDILDSNIKGSSTLPTSLSSDNMLSHESPPDRNRTDIEPIATLFKPFSLGGIGKYSEQSQSMFNLTSLSKYMKIGSKIPIRSKKHPFISISKTETNSGMLAQSPKEQVKLHAVRETRSLSLGIMDSNTKMFSDSSPKEQNTSRVISRMQSVPVNDANDTEKCIKTSKLVKEEYVVLQKDGVKMRRERTTLTSQTDLSQMQQEHSTSNNILTFSQTQPELDKADPSDLNSKEINQISELVNKDWKLLARELEIKECDITDIDHRHPKSGPIELCFQAMDFWLHKHNGNKKKLVNLLTKSRLFAFLIEKVFPIGDEKLQKV